MIKFIKKMIILLRGLPCNSIGIRYKSKLSMTEAIKNIQKMKALLKKIEN